MVCFDLSRAYDPIASDYGRSTEEPSLAFLLFRAYNHPSEECAAYKRHLAAQLERKLRQIEPEIDIHRCADSPPLGVECSPACHDEWPDELDIIEIESGGRAWLCCSLDRALNPTKHLVLEQTSGWSTPTA